MRALILIILIASLVSCKETHCPAFPTNLVEYYPYSNDEVLKFKNYNNDTLTLRINNNWVSDSYTFDWNCKCSCEADAGFNTDSDSKYSLKIEGRINFYNENSTSILSCNFYDAQLSNDNFETQEVVDNPYGEEMTKSFGDTIIMEKQDYYRIGMVKIIISKGIVEFWDKKQNCNWIMIE